MKETVIPPNGIQLWWRHRVGQKLLSRRSVDVFCYSDAKPEHNLHIHSKNREKKKELVSVIKRFASVLTVVFPNPRHLMYKPPLVREGKGGRWKEDNNQQKSRGDGYSEVSVTIKTGSASLWGILVHNWVFFFKKHWSEVYSGVDFQGNVSLGN